MMNQCEADSGAAGGAGELGLAAVEGLEDSFELAARDAGGVACVRV